MTYKIAHLGDLGVEPKIGDFPPKWMVKIMENPIKMDDLGGKPPIFRNTRFKWCKNAWNFQPHGPLSEMWPFGSVLLFFFAIPSYQTTPGRSLTHLPLTSPPVTIKLYFINEVGTKNGTQPWNIKQQTAGHYTLEPLHEVENHRVSVQIFHIQKSYTQ